MAIERESRTASHLLGANIAWIAVSWILASAPGLQGQATGISVPQPVTVDDSAPAKPSAAIPLTPATTAQPAPGVTYGAYVPYRAPGAATLETPAPPASTFDSDAGIVTSDSLSGRRPLSTDKEPASADPDAGIVTHVPTRPGEINDGTLIKTRLGQTLSTVSTDPGSHFSAEVSEPVMQDGRVYIPAGSMLEGRVTWVSAGRRIGGRAAIHIEPQRITLPDGTIYTIHARVIDTSSWQNTAVDREGTIIRRDNLKGTLEAGGLVTAGTMAAGAVIAGPPGALIGAGIGAGATAIVWFKQDRQAQLPKDLGVIFSLTAPLSVEPVHADLPATVTNNRQGGE